MFISVISFRTLFWLAIKIFPLCVCRAIYRLNYTFEPVPIIARITWILSFGYALSITKIWRRMAYNWCTPISVPDLFAMTFFIFTLRSNTISVLTNTFFIEWIINRAIPRTNWNIYTCIPCTVSPIWANASIKVLIPNSPIIAWYLRGDTFIPIPYFVFRADTRTISFTPYSSPLARIWYAIISIPLGLARALTRL